MLIFLLLERYGCRGRDSNPWTSAGQGPEPCAVYQAWLPLQYNYSISKITASINTYNLNISSNIALVRKIIMARVV